FFHWAYHGPRGLLIWDRTSRVLIPSDGPVTIRAELCAPDREVTPGSSIGMLQLALAVALRREGLFHLHAAALIHPSGASVLVAGGSGAGKPTTTLAMLEAGAAYLGDEFLFLRAAPAGAVEVRAFPREFHLGPRTLAAFPRLLPLAGPPG